jgi:hypothetical protein
MEVKIKADVEAAAKRGAEAKFKAEANIKADAEAGAGVKMVRAKDDKREVAKAMKETKMEIESHTTIQRRSKEQGSPKRTSKKAKKAKKEASHEEACNCVELSKISLFTILCFSVGMRMSGSILMEQMPEGSAISVAGQAAQVLQSRVAEQDALIEQQLGAIKALNERVAKLEGGAQALLVQLESINIADETNTDEAAIVGGGGGDGLIFTPGGSEMLTLPGPMDTAALGASFTVEVSIKLSSQVKEPTVKTILTNKVGGCQGKQCTVLTHCTHILHSYTALIQVRGDGAHHGYSLSINSWGTQVRSTVLFSLHTVLYSL